MQPTGKSRKLSASVPLRWGIGPNGLCPRCCSNARSVSRPVPRPPSLSVPGSAGTRRAAHTSPGGCFRCAGFGSCSANRCGAPSAGGRRRAGQSPSRFNSPGRERVGSRLGSVVRLRCSFPPRLRALGPGLPPLVRRSALWSVAPPGGFSLALGGWSFRPPASLCFSGCLPRSFPAPSPPALRLAAAAPPLWLLQR